MPQLQVNVRREELQHSQEETAGGHRRNQEVLFLPLRRKILLETDYMPLESLRTSKNANARLLRWAMYLQQFYFAIRYINGSANLGVDFLSRLVENDWTRGISAQRSGGAREERSSVKGQNVRTNDENRGRCVLIKDKI